MIKKMTLRMLCIEFDHRVLNSEHLSHADPKTPRSAITCDCLTSEGVGAASEGCDAKERERKK